MLPERAARVLQGQRHARAGLRPLWLRRRHQVRLKKKLKKNKRHARAGLRPLWLRRRHQVRLKKNKINGMHVQACAPFL